MSTASLGHGLQGSLRGEVEDLVRPGFPEKDIYRIDHYVAKEMIQTSTCSDSKNTIFGPVWNRHHIDNVQITVLEKEGVGTRGGYYDHTGAAGYGTEPSAPAPRHHRHGAPREPGCRRCAQ